MKILMRRWFLGLAMLFVFAGVYTPPQADAQVVVKIGSHRRPVHHYYRHHRVYRHR
jgi:hypothetical protein